jgi:hypothetical protein
MHFLSTQQTKKSAKVLSFRSISIDTHTAWISLIKFVGANRTNMMQPRLFGYFSAAGKVTSLRGGERPNNQTKNNYHSHDLDDCLKRFIALSRTKDLKP